MSQISIIVPVYNVEKYLHRCVDSILAQTFTDFELILIDDGSTDSSGRICDEYAQKDSRINVIHQKNQGQAASRNIGVKRATAKWIHFVDSDDEIHPRMLEALHHAIVLYNVDMAICGGIQGYDEQLLHRWNELKFPLKIDRVSINEDTLIEFYNDPGFRYGTVWASLISKRIITMLPFTEGRIYEDAAVVCQWLCEAGVIANIHENLYFYRRNESSTTGSSFSMKRLDVLWSKEQQERFFEKKNYQRMKSIKVESYIYSAAEFCKEIRRINGSACKIRELRKAVFRKYIKNWKILNISKKRKLIILENMFPRLMQMYWFGSVLIDKINRFGK